MNLAISKEVIVSNIDISNLSFNPLPSITLKETKRFYSQYCRTLSKLNSEYSVLSRLNCIQEKKPEFLLKMSAT